jgi:anti-sigma regulatory factor (Ser/Thr protein kinase)
MIDRSTFANVLASVRQARRWVASRLEGVPAEVGEAVAVMVSELATNSVRHAASSFSVSVDRSPEAIRVEVSDSGNGEPTMQAPHADQPSGRGLRIVDALADDWGVRYSAGSGKTVWFTIATG